MKEASKILLLIGFIFGILGSVGFLIAMIVFFVLASPAMREIIIEGINNGTVKSDFPGSPEEIATFVQQVFNGAAIGFLFAVLFSIAMCVIAMIARSKETSALYITSIVFSVLGANVLILLGSIFGLVELSQPKK